MFSLMCLNYLSKPLPDHPFLSYGPSNTPSPRQGVQNDGFLLNYYGTRHRTEILRLSSKSWRPPLQNYESFKKNLTQTKVFISVSKMSIYTPGLCTCLNGAIPALIAALPALIATDSFHAGLQTRMSICPHPQVCVLVCARVFQD